MKKLKVLQIIDSLNVGGAEVLAVNIANSLYKKGIESHLCATRKEGGLKENISKDVKYLFLERKKIIDFKAFFKLKSYIKINEITIIHAHSTSSFIGFCMKLFYPKVKLIWHNHTGAYLYLKGIKLQMLKIYSKKINYIITVNKELDNWSKKVLKHNKGSYLPNFPIFINQTKKTKLLGNTNKKIVCLAGLRKEKDHFNLINAFKIIKDKYPDWTLHLIGKDYKDSYSESINSYIHNKELSNNIFLYDVCLDIKNILEQATIGVLSSKSEGLPISLLEYGLAKLPILVTNVGECKNVVKNEKSIVAPQRSDKFAEFLLRLIEDPKLRNEISIKFNKEIMLNYSENTIINKLIKIYYN